MSTQSAVGFEWSIKLIGARQYYVGIATTLKPGSLISNTDQNSIIYNCYYSTIQIGLKAIHSNRTQQNAGDVIRFEFRPKTKKLVIELVRVVIFIDAVLSRNVKHGRYEIDLQDNVYYFPVIQSTADSALEAHLIG